MSPYLQAFQQLDRWLYQHRHWWQFQPFHHVTSRWVDDAPQLHARIGAWSADDALAMSADLPALAELLHPMVENADLGLRVEAALIDLPDRPMPSRSASEPIHKQPNELVVSEAVKYKVGGRKWQQIMAFANMLPAPGHVPEVLEWCAGKGHLGRLLAANHYRLTSLEWQSALCDSGRQLAQHADVQQTFHCCDVLHDNTDDYVKHGVHAVALHACGDLHTRLIRQVVNGGAEGLSIAPCCYNLTQQSIYQPLSSFASANSPLRLARADLALPLRRTVTAGAREQRQRDQELLWRLAFDSLQRGLTGSNHYMPLPTIPKAHLKADFGAFCAWALAMKKITDVKVNQSDVEQALAAGRDRVVAVRQMEMVQALFMRPLELWLLLDMALVLEEKGYQVALAPFCEFSLTPRNWLLQAVRA